MHPKTILLIIAILVNTISHSQNPIVDSSKIVKVLSFNILHGATTKGDFDLDLIANVIKDVNPDFVAMQEVDFKTFRAKKYDLVTELGWRTKLIPLFGKAMEYNGGEYGEGILSKNSLITSRNMALPYSNGNEPRTALEIVTTINPKDTIAFIGTHLDHLDDPGDRIAQAKKINELFLSNPYPTILAGDLNDIPGSEPIAILENFWTSAYSQDEIKYTYPSDYPVLKIDYIMFYPKNRWEVIETQVIQNTVASDHCGYLVVLKLVDK